MSNVLYTYVDALTTKLKTCTHLSGNEQVTVFESKDLLSNDESSSIVYPRIEVHFEKLKSNGYESQRSMQWALRYWVVGYLDKVKEDGETPSWTLTDFENISAFGMNVVSLIYGMLDDAQAGTLNIPAFQMMGQYPELFLDFELIPSKSVFLFQAEAILLQNDTEE